MSDLLFTYLPLISSSGTFETFGFKSALIDLSKFTTLNINFACTKDTTFRIKASPTLGETDSYTYFEKSITANQVFHRRFANIQQFIQIEIINITGVAGSFNLMSYGSVHTQFDASTFLNSKIGIDDGTNLTRVGNDYNLDMVREIHEDFKKVNIQTISSHQPTTEATLGLQNQNFLSIPIASYTWNINLAGTQDTSTGTGARQITIDYIDANYDEQTANISTGAGGVFSTGITGRAILRAEVTSVGSGLVNSGAVVFQDSTNTHTFCRIETGDCVSHTGIYLIPRNKELIVADASISMVGFNGTVRIYEYDYGGIGTRGSIGDFRQSSAYNSIVYKLNGKINEKRMVVLNIIPDVGAPTITSSANINVNAVLCPFINSF